MNINNIKHMAKARLHTTKIGRTLCRLAGEESGQGAMEYVVIATLICAAIAVGIWLFGAQIAAMFGIAGESTTGKHEEAIVHTEDQRTLATEAARKAAEEDKRWTTSEKKDGNIVNE